MEEVKLLLFKPVHVPWILDKSPYTGLPKTQTRRLWKKQRVKVGSIQKAKTVMLSKDYFAELRILRVWMQRLRDITEEEVRAEGYPTVLSYFHALREINKLKMSIRLLRELKVFVVEFEVVK